MNFALIIYDTLDTISGSHLYDRKLVEHLIERGHTVEIISLPVRNYRDCLQDNFSTPLLERLVTGGFDLILQDETTHPSLAWLNRQLKKLTQTPLISIVHHLRCNEEWGLIRRLIFRRVEKEYLKTVDGFIFNSKTTRKSVDKLIGRKHLNTVAYPAGDHFYEDLEAFTTGRDSRSGKLKLLFVGNIIERKGLDVLLMALKQLPAGKWELDIVGSPELEPEYVQKLHRFIDDVPRLKTAIRFFGVLTKRQLAIRYSLNHVLVLPSTYEGFGITYLEGMGFGLPAVATSAGGASELINHRENGFLLPVNEPNILAQALRLLIKDRVLLGEMSDNAKRTFDDFPSWEVTCVKIEGFLLEIVG
jgi:glycosyltransferase involved in cell wall biosynthesis